eukprot:2290460-Rhodomonas_salina.1
MPPGSARHAVSPGPRTANARKRTAKCTPCSLRAAPSTRRASDPTRSPFLRARRTTAQHVTREVSSSEVRRNEGWGRAGGGGRGRPARNGDLGWGPTARSAQPWAGCPQFPTYFTPTLTRTLNQESPANTDRTTEPFRGAEREGQREEEKGSEDQRGGEGRDDESCCSTASAVH